MATKQPDSPAARPAAPPAAPAGRQRKPWRPKSPSQIVLEQGDKLKKEIAELEEQIRDKRKQLQKFEEVRRILEAS